MKRILSIIACLLVANVATASVSVCDGYDPFYLDSHCVVGKIHPNYKPLEIVTDKGFYDCHLRMVRNLKLPLIDFENDKYHIESDESIVNNFFLNRISELIFPGSSVEYILYDNGSEHELLVKWFDSPDKCPHINNIMSGGYEISRSSNYKLIPMGASNGEKIFALSILLDVRENDFLFLRGDNYPYNMKVFWLYEPDYIHEYNILEQLDSNEEMVLFDCSNYLSIKDLLSITIWENIKTFSSWIDSEYFLLRDDMGWHNGDVFIWQNVLFAWSEIKMSMCSLSKIRQALNQMCNYNPSEITNMIQCDLDNLKDYNVESFIQYHNLKDIFMIFIKNRFSLMCQNHKS